MIINDPAAKLRGIDRVRLRKICYAAKLRGIKPEEIEEENIRYIFTASQLKMWKMYESWEAYKKSFKKNKLKILINSYANPAKETVPFSYQYLQTLPYGCDIEGLCSKAKEDLKRLHNDLEYVREAMGLTDENETDDDIAENEKITENGEKADMPLKEKSGCNSYIAKAMKIYPQIIYDPYIEKRLGKRYSRREGIIVPERYRLEVITAMLCLTCMRSASTCFAEMIILTGLYRKIMYTTNTMIGKRQQNPLYVCGVRIYPDTNTEGVNW